jgi:hypothetical protein
MTWHVKLAEPQIKGLTLAWEDYIKKNQAAAKVEL